MHTLINTAWFFVLDAGGRTFDWGAAEVFTLRIDGEVTGDLCLQVLVAGMVFISILPVFNIEVGFSNKSIIAADCRELRTLALMGAFRGHLFRYCYELCARHGYVDIEVI